jgi:hypothetical protein
MKFTTICNGLSATHELNTTDDAVKFRQMYWGCYYINAQQMDTVYSCVKQNHDLTMHIKLNIYNNFFERTKK